jgi:hypothetical protein
MEKDEGKGKEGKDGEGMGEGAGCHRQQPMKRV